MVVPATRPSTPCGAVPCTYPCTYGSVSDGFGVLLTVCALVGIVLD